MKSPRLLFHIRMLGGGMPTRSRTPSCFPLERLRNRDPSSVSAIHIVARITPVEYIIDERYVPSRFDVYPNWYVGTLLVNQETVSVQKVLV